MVTETVRVTSQDVTISLLIWRRYRRAKPGLLERILDLNPGVAAAGAILPIGTEILMPVEPRTVQTDQTAIALWD
jgi:phage tail protein X